jgi:hypothetical protein
VGHAEELDSALAKGANRPDDVLGPQRDVLRAGVEVVVEDSWIWLFFLPAAGSLIGNLIRPFPFCMTLLMRAEYSVWITLSS